MNYKIVADSSADLLTLDQVAFDNVPLHVMVGEQDFIDDEHIDCDEMQRAIDAFQGKTSTACPGPEDWMNAFEDAEVVFCVTLTSNLSGANTSANIAKQMYEETYPGRKVYVFDTLSAGPGVTLIVEKIQEYILQGFTPEEIEKHVVQYMKQTHLLFSLASLKNFASNGRINPLIAKGIGILGIRIVGIASEEGTLQPIDKARGDGRAIQCIVKHMKEMGYVDGKISIAHNNNIEAAEELKNLLIKTFGKLEVKIHKTRALCSYYAEPGSVLVGFEA